MVPMADTSTPAPKPAKTPAEQVTEVRQSIASRFDLTDPRNLIGLGVFAFCAGIVVGAKLMRGAATSVGNVRSIADGQGQPQPGTPPAHVPHPVDQPCAGCRERAIQEGRAIAAQEAARRRRESNSPEPSAADVDAVERNGVVDRQLANGVDGLKTFSMYAESTLPEEMVTSPGDSSLPPEQ
jgi:hypothetical protein